MRLQVAFALVAIGGCSGSGGDADCPIPLPADCEPLYEPVFEEIHARTIERSCALSGCHAADSVQGGLDLEGEQQAWAALVDEGRVVPGDPECSDLMKHLHGVGAPLMPPGRPLSDAERCAVQQWIADGALP